MPEHRIIGCDRLTVNPASRELHFELMICDAAEPAAFVASFEVATQFTEALGRAVSDSRREIPPAELVVSCEVRKDQSENLVIMQFGTSTGLPCSFALSPEIAIKLWKQLKAEG